MFTLPTELVDHIFSSFQAPGDTDALRACSLVCSTWLPVAREHLFATLRTKEGQDKGARSLSDFVHVLASSTGVGHAVQRLVINGFLGDSKLPFADLVIVLAQLPRLRHVSFHNVRIPTIPDVTMFETRICSLRSLELSNVGFYLDNSSNIFRLLHVFDSLGELTIERVWFRHAYGASHEAIVPTFPIPAHLSTRSLTLRYADDRTELLLAAFAHTRIPATLERLHISFYDFTPLVPSIVRFLSSPACRVQHLAFDFARCFPYAFWSDKRGLLLARTAIEQVLRPALPNLSSVRTFELHTGNVPPEAGAFWDMCGAVLCVLPLGVEEVRVHVVNEQFGLEVGMFVRALGRYEALERVLICGLGEVKRKEIKRTAEGMHGRLKLWFVDENCNSQTFLL